MSKNEKLVTDLMQQDSFQGPTSNKIGISKSKIESHLSMNLKRKVKEFQHQVHQKQEEIDTLRRNIKSTKIAEIEVEMKMYIDECTRLRQQLEEVIMSKDRFADPDEVKAIEDKFNQQDQLIQNMKNENNDLVGAYNMKEEEMNQLKALIGDMERKIKSQSTSAKTATKYKKECNSLNKEVKGLKKELDNIKGERDDLLVRLDSQTRAKKGGNSQINQSYNTGESGNERQLRSELSSKDAKINEQNGIIQSLQKKLQDKIASLGQAEFTINQLTNQLNNAGIQAAQVSVPQQQDEDDYQEDMDQLNEESHNQ